MRISNFRQKRLPLVAVTCLLWFTSTSCGMFQEGKLTSGAKSVLIGAGLGAGLGAVSGALFGDEDEDIFKGALVGAGAGALAGWLVEKYDVRKTKSVEAIKSDYGESHGAKEILIHNYQSVVVADVLRQGDTATWTTSFDVQAPRDLAGRIVEVRTIQDPDGNQITTRDYDYSADINETNGYAFDLTLPVPEEASEGLYTYVSTLTVGDGERVYETNHNTFQIVHRAGTWEIYASTYSDLRCRP